MAATRADQRVNPEVFHAKVYEICRLIPPGRVTTYDSRLVGTALRFLSDGTVPWQRVISSSGGISDRGDGGTAAARQAELLRNEGVHVDEARGGGVSIELIPATAGRYRIKLSQFGWFPDFVHLEGFDDEIEDERRRAQDHVEEDEDEDEQEDDDESDLSDPSPPHHDDDDDDDSELSDPPSEDDHKGQKQR